MPFLSLRRFAASANHNRVGYNSRVIATEKSNFGNTIHKAADHWRSILAVCLLGIVCVVVPTVVISSASGRVQHTSSQTSADALATLKLSQPSTSNLPSSSLLPQTSFYSTTQSPMTTSSSSNLPSSSSPPQTSFHSTTQSPTTTSSTPVPISVQLQATEKVALLAAGASCSSDTQCDIPYVCYTDSDSKTATCCGKNIRGCPGAPCSSPEDCLDPYGCVEGLGTCCGYSPYTVIRQPTCYTAEPTTTT
ncbi:hypothetical protein F5B20DRAFT_520942 [Whalleya microplaca]|nr:hypothetical protein F5B20DRAFT_520942 [Whalleya microplaca]